MVWLTAKLSPEDILSNPDLGFQDSTSPVAELDLTVSPVKYSLVLNWESNNGKLFWLIILPEEFTASYWPGIEPTGLPSRTSEML